MSGALRWPDCRNVRDVGGLRVAGGGRVRGGALVRADDLAGLTAAGIAAVRAYGVVRVVDLRSAEEVRRRPGPFVGDPLRVHAPLVDEAVEYLRDPSLERTLSAVYRGSIERNARHIVAGLVALADAPPGAVVVHCLAGRDRTGMHVALALGAAGVGADEIAADYARSGGDTAPVLAMLDAIHGTYGDAGTYLRQHGMTATQLTRLRTRLL
jgi:protein-tyrosine phosphatase